MKCIFCDKDMKTFEWYESAPVSDGFCCEDCFDKYVNKVRLKGIAIPKGGNDE